MTARGRNDSLLGMLFCSRRLLVLIPLLAACGGKVVFVADADAGTGGAGGASASAATSSTSSGFDCKSLQADLEAATTAAQACSPQLDIVQCTGQAIIDDACACPSVVLNETQPTKVSAAVAAYDAFAQHGCAEQCGKVCMPAFAGTCQPSQDGMTGSCIAVFTK